MIPAHPAFRFTLAALLAFGSAGPVLQARAATPAFVAEQGGAMVQSLRFCRPGERPVRPGQCLVRGSTRPLT